MLAAFGNPGELDEVLSDGATPQTVIDALNTPEAHDAIPVGAYLTSIAVQPPPAEHADLSTIAAARLAYQAFSALPSDDDVALADHVETVLLDVETAYEELRREASGLIRTRDEAWGPLAVDLADWLKKYEANAAVALRQEQRRPGQDRAARARDHPPRIAEGRGRRHRLR